MDSKIYDKNEFNWDDFRDGKIAVWCETRELREDFLKQCDNNNIRWRTNGELASHNIEVTSCEGEDCTAYVCKHFGIAFSDYDWFQEQGIKVIKWSIDKKNKVYKGWEIVKMLDEQELSEGTILQDEDENFYTVSKGILLDGKRDIFDSHYETSSSYIVKNVFTVVETRKRYTFNEAISSFLEGEIIEDKCGMCYRLLDTDTVAYKANHMDKWSKVYGDTNIFSLYTTRGYWYIHNE